jgi:hypothetical protein
VLTQKTRGKKWLVSFQPENRGGGNCRINNNKREEKVRRRKKSSKRVESPLPLFREKNEKD